MWQQATDTFYHMAKNENWIFQNPILTGQQTANTEMIMPQSYMLENRCNMGKYARHLKQRLIP